MYNEERVFETKDFYLTALMMEKGFNLLGSRKDIKENAVYFQVKINNEELFNQTMNSFVNYNSTVNMNKFVKIMGKLRHELDKYRR